VFERRGRHGKVEVLYNPVDVSAFARARRSDEVRRALGAEPGHQLIATVGRLHPRKDLETFLRASAEVARNLPDARFAIVGSAEAPIEKDYQRRLEALVGQLGLRERLTFAGARRDIPEVMASLDVFVLSSRHEGFGRVLGEAMAAARPVVVTDEGALPELVACNRYGLIAGPGDASAFARRIRQLLEDPIAAKDLGKRASERAMAFDSREVATRVRARYETLVNDGRRSS
jgi:glycosyltransferase involved in cell wall biosynthesis